MLGATDASHIIRTIEYWDIERRRYPAYEHVAVIVAEDITSRFLNVLSLFAGSIPLIAIQLNALKVGDQIVLDCVKVLDRRDLRTDDESGDVSGPADRAYWEEKAGTSSLRLIDAVLSLVNEKAEPPMDLDFIRGTIRLRDHGRATKFISFKPRRKHVTVRFKIPNPEAWAERCENAGLASDVHRNGHLRVKVEPGEFEQHRSLLTEAVTEAVKAYSE